MEESDEIKFEDDEEPEAKTVDEGMDEVRSEVEENFGLGGAEDSAEDGADEFVDEPMLLLPLFVLVLEVLESERSEAEVLMRGRKDW
jgi:hypothetical protein